MRICIVVFPGGNIGRHNEVAIRRGSTVYNAKIRFFELANSFAMNVHCPFLLSGKLSYSPGAPLTYFNDGGGGVRVIFLGLRFWPKVIFWGL